MNTTTQKGNPVATPAGKYKRYKPYFARAMSMQEFVTTNYAYREERFTEDYPFKFVWDEDLVEVYAKDIREMMIDLYADHLE